MWTVESHPILTKRELLAAIAMHALTVQEHTLLSPKECARGAVNRADELIEALAGKEGVMKDEVFARVVQGAQEAVEINRLRAERDALKKDTERYRGLLREAYGCLSDEDDALAQRIKKALRGEGE